MSYKQRSPIIVAEGGTGAQTLTDHGVLLGSGTGAVTVTAVGTAGQILTSNGAGVDPTFQAAGGGAASFVGATTANGQICFVGSTGYFAPFYSVGITATQANAQYVCPTSGTLSNLYVYVYSNASTTDVSITLNVNNVNSTLTTTITALTTGVFSDLVNTVAVVAGDEIQIQAQSASDGAINGAVSLKLVA